MKRIVYWSLLLTIPAAFLLVQIFGALFNSVYFLDDAVMREIIAAPAGEAWDSWKELGLLVQISDLHLSRFKDRTRGIDLWWLCNSTIPLIKPKLTIVSGDMTDAKDARRGDSAQQQEEWQVYERALRENNVGNHTAWIDIRGNHDASDVFALGGEDDLYARFSHSKRHHSFKTSLVIGTQEYAFIAIDATPKPGPKRPFNFFGHLPTGVLDDIEGLLAGVPRGVTIIVFGHYPLTTVVSGRSSSGRSITELLDQYAAVYLCGHLHTLFDFVVPMHAYHPGGFLEMELADWKERRVYRVLSLDHGLLSSVDVPLHSWPVILITNPKDARQFSAKEPWQTISQSTHVRVLVISPNTPINIDVLIDKTPLNCSEVHDRPSDTSAQAHLYTCAWTPRDLSPGLHIVTATVSCEGGLWGEHSQPFSIDGSRASGPLQASVVLLTDFQALVKYLLLFLVVFTLMILFSPLLPTIGTRRGPAGTLAWWQARVQVLFNDRFSYSSLMIYFLFLLAGPWFVGYLSSSNLGVFTLHGIYLGGRLFPTPYALAYGVIQLVFGIWPLLLFVTRAPSLPGLRGMLSIPVWAYIVFSALVQAGLWHEVWKGYGWLAALLSPVRSGFFILAVILLVRRRQRLTSGPT